MTYCQRVIFSFLAAAGASRKHKVLCCYGKLTPSPFRSNDGTTALSDVCRWPGNVYPVWGADHYFRPENVASGLIMALFHYLSFASFWAFSNVLRRGTFLMLPS